MSNNPPIQAGAGDLGDLGDPVIRHFKFARLLRDDRSAARRDVFRLRYDIYCVECGFLDPTAYPEGIESDEYDENSVHFTAHNFANELVGSLRLVHAPDEERFPFEHHCKALFDNVALPAPEQCGEVSRLVVRRTYRRRAGDTLAGIPEAFFTDETPAVPLPPPSGERRSNRPELLLGLYREMYRYSLEAGIRYWYAAMERSLARALLRLQFAFVPIGEEVDYYGPVIPYIADLRELEERLRERAPDMLVWFRGR